MTIRTDEEIGGGLKTGPYRRVTGRTEVLSPGDVTLAFSDDVDPGYTTTGIIVFPSEDQKVSAIFQDREEFSGSYENIGERRIEGKIGDDLRAVIRTPTIRRRLVLRNPSGNSSDMRVRFALLFLPQSTTDLQ